VIDTVIAVTVVAGGPGYLVAAVMVLGLRVWIGQRTKGLVSARWIGIVINSLLLFLLLLSLVYALTFLNALLPPSRERRDWSRAALAILLSLAPYFVVFTLGPWWLGTTRRQEAEVPLPLTPQIVPDEKEA
jgi:apolipoprotein N-acyltransferase